MVVTAPKTADTQRTTRLVVPQLDDDQPAARPAQQSESVQPVRLASADKKFRVPALQQPELAVPGSVRRTAIPGSRPPAEIASGLDAKSAPELIRTFAGMPIEQRTAVAESYFKADRNVPPSRALDAFVKRFGNSGNDAEQVILSDLLSPENRNGQLSDAATVHLDLRKIPLLSKLGIGDANVASAATVLERSTTQQLATLDTDLKKFPGGTLAERIAQVEDERGRAYLQFLADPKNRDAEGRLSHATRTAWAMRNSYGNFTFTEKVTSNVRGIVNADESRAGLLGPLLQLNGKDADAARAAYNAIHGDAPRIPEPDEQPRTLADYRLHLAGHGLVLDATDARNVKKASQHSDGVARYIAATLHHNSARGASDAEVDQAFTMVRPNLGKGEQPDGRPTMQQVVEAYRATKLEMEGREVKPWKSLLPEERESWVKNIRGSMTSALQTSDVDSLLKGRGADNPASRARQIDRALKGNITGPYTTDLYRALDLRGVPVERRAQFMRETQAAFAELPERGDMSAAVGARLGTTLTLPSGRIVPSQALAYVQGNGAISDAQRAVYAIHDSGPMKLGNPRVNDVATMAQELSPFDRLVLRQQYADATGSDIFRDLGSVPGYEARGAEAALLISAHERNDIINQLTLMTRPLTAETLPPGTDLAAAQAARDNYWRTVIPNETARKAFLTRFQGPNAAQAITELANGAIDSNKMWKRTLEAFQREASGTRLSEVVVNAVTNNGAVMRAQYAELVNQLRTASRNGWTQQDLARIDPQRMGQLVRSVRERAHQEGVNVDGLSDAAINTLTLAALGISAPLTAGSSLAPVILAGVTAGTRLGVRAATGRLEGHVARETVLGALPGLLSGVGVSGALGDELLGASVAGGLAYTGYRVPDRYMEQNWHDPARAIERMARSSGTDFAFGTATSAAFYLAVRAISPRHDAPPQQQAQQPDGGRPGPGQQGRKDPPLDRPVQNPDTQNPARPSRPSDVTPDPVGSSNGPGLRPGMRPTQTGTATGPTNHPGLGAKQQPMRVDQPARDIPSGQQALPNRPANGAPSGTTGAPQRTTGVLKPQSGTVQQSLPTDELPVNNVPVDKPVVLLNRVQHGSVGGSSPVIRQ